MQNDISHNYEKIENKKNQLGFMLLLAALVAITPFSIDVYMPAFGEMAKFYNTDFHTIELSISVFFIGSAIGQIFFAPFSDKIGRRPVLFTGLFVFLLATLLIINSTTIGELLTYRFMQALGCGCVSVTAGALVRDLFGEQDSARMFSMISTIMMAAPFTAPMIGAGLLVFFSWQSIFWFLLIYSLVITLLMFFKLNETIEKSSDKLSFSKAATITRSSFAKYRMVLSKRGAFVYLLCSAFCGVWLILFLTDAAFIYIEYFKVSKLVFPILFGAASIVVIFANFINLSLLKKYHVRIIFKNAIRLQFSLVVIALIYVWTFEPNLWVVFILILLTQSTLHFITANGMACFLSYYSENSGSAMAMFGTFRFILGGLTGILLSVLHNNTLLPFTLLSFIALSFAFILSFKLDTRPIELIRADTSHGGVKNV